MWCFSSKPFHFQILPSKWGKKKHDLKKNILNWIDNRFSCKYVVFGLYSRNQTWVALLRFLVPVKGWNSLRHSSEVMLATLSKDSDCSIGSLTLNFRSPLRFPNPYVFYRLFFYLTEINVLISLQNIFSLYPSCSSWDFLLFRVEDLYSSENSGNALPDTWLRRLTFWKLYVSVLISTLLYPSSAIADDRACDTTYWRCIGIVNYIFKDKSEYY